MHTCGSIYKLIPDLIEVGVDILNPVQISATDMDPARLKREFGQDVTFWGGGADTQHVLPNATPEQVRQHVRELIEVFAPGGGYVFCQVHNIQANGVLWQENWVSWPPGERLPQEYQIMRQLPHTLIIRARKRVSQYG